MGQRAGMIVKIENCYGSKADVIALYNQWAYGYKLIRTLGHFSNFARTNKHWRYNLRKENIVTLASYIQKPMEDGIFLSNWVFEDMIPLACWDNNDGFLLLDLSKEVPTYAILDTELNHLTIDAYIKNGYESEVIELAEEIATLKQDLSVFKRMTKTQVLAFMKSTGCLEEEKSLEKSNEL